MYQPLSGLLSRAKLILRATSPVPGYVSTAPKHSSFFESLDLELSTPGADLGDQYQKIMRYLLTGFSEFSVGSGARLEYIGLMSKSGRAADCAESFARLAFILCGWLAGGRSRYVSDLKGIEHDLVEIIDEGLSTGLLPGTHHYWGPIADNDPRLPQAAILAAGFVISNDKVWPNLKASTRRLFCEWIAPQPVIVPDNNWHLMKLALNMFFNKEEGSGLGRNVHADKSDMGIKAFFDTFYVGQGWFKDGHDRQRVDYYNVWIHFFLYIISRLSTSDDERSLIKDARTEFVKSYKFFFTAKGVPLFGRSIGYRMATPLPLILHSLDSDEDTGFSRRALDDVLRFFVANGSLRDGAITQGYFETDARLTDTYTGPGGCLWSLSALAMAWAFPNDSKFWSAAPVSYPVEEKDFQIELRNIGVTVVGSRSTETVTLHREYGCAFGTFEKQTNTQLILEKLLRRPIRPGNHEAKYPKIVTSWPPIFPIEQTNFFDRKR